MGTKAQTHPPHLQLREGETWTTGHRRFARYVIRRKSDGAYRHSTFDGKKSWTSFGTWLTIGGADGCCLSCARFTQGRLDLETEIVERRWDPTDPREFRINGRLIWRGAWIEVGVVDRRGLAASVEGAEPE